MGRWITSFAAGLLLAFGWAGCGSSEDEAREALDAYLAASEDGDAQAVCELWSPWIVRDLFTLAGIEETSAECEEIDRFTSVILDSVVFSAAEADPAIEALEETDDAVTFDVEGIDGGIEIRVFDGEWRMNSLCAEGSCFPADETPAQAPIGG